MMPTGRNCIVNGPYCELTCQPDRAILRAMDGAGSGAAKTGRSEPCKNGTFAANTVP